MIYGVSPQPEHAPENSKYAIAAASPHKAAALVAINEITDPEVQLSAYEVLGKISVLDPEKLPDIDLITMGFPCQTFSIAGKRRGFEDTRGTLFFEAARIAAVKKPKYLLLENVPGLLSHDGGRTFAVILGTLDELGYGATRS